MIPRLTNGMSESTIIVEHSERVGIIKLNRPRAYNALSGTLINELLDALRSFENNPNIGAIILTGNEKGFCAGADIKEQSELSFVDAYNQDYLKNLNDGFFAVHKPIIGVINGIALGGGCELAMMCDILYAAETATFGQPNHTGNHPRSWRDAALNKGYWEIKSNAHDIDGGDD
jgi:enoyl-CoA hydratase